MIQISENLKENGFPRWAFVCLFTAPSPSTPIRENREKVNKKVNKIF